MHRSITARREPVERGRTFRSFDSRNFRLFFGGQLISQIGNWLTMIAQTLLVLKLTDSGLALGLLAACQFGPVLLFGAWAGLVADRMDKRSLLMRVQTLAMLQSFVLAFVAFMDNPPVAAIYVVAVLGGFCTAFDNPVRRSFVVEMVPESDVQNAASLNSALMTGSRIVGPALAGLLIQVVGYGWTFAIDGLSYVAVLIGLAKMRTSELHPSTPTPRGKGQVREGLRYVRTTPELWVPMAMMTLIGTMAFNFQTVIPLFVKRSLGGDDTAFTLLFSAISVGSLFAALHAARRVTMSVRYIVGSALFFGVAMVLVGISPNLATAYPTGILMGIGSVTFITASTAIVQLRAAPSMRGRVLALQGMLFLGTTPIGGPLLGFVADHFGARSAVHLGGISCLLAAAWGWRAIRGAQPSDRGVTTAPAGAQTIPAG